MADHCFGAALLHYGPKTTEAIDLGVAIRDQGTTFGYDARLGFAPDDTLYFQTKNATKIHPDDTQSIRSLGDDHRESHLHDDSYGDPSVAVVNHWLGRMTFYHFHDTSPQSRLRTHARRENDRYPRSDRSILAAYLLRLKESEDPSDQMAWQRINRHCRHIAPANKQIDPVAVNGNVRLDWVDDRDESFWLSPVLRWNPACTSTDHLALPAPTKADQDR